MREMRILVAPESFEDDKLRALANELFDRYPSPNTMDVSLVSHVDQLRSYIDGKPNNALELILDTLDPILPRNRYSSGVFFRLGTNEVIRYNRPGERTRTLVLEGHDPY
jgi:hypothetical protein